MTETINGLLTQKPGREPEQGQVKCFTVEHKPAVNGKKAWIKVKNATPDKGGESYMILNVQPTGFTDSYGNLSFNIELEKIPAPQGSQPPSERATGASTAQQTPNPYDARSARIERQSARRDAIEFYKLELHALATSGVVPTPSLDRVKEIMTTMEGWLDEEKW